MAKKTYHYFDESGWYCGSGQTKADRSTETEPPADEGDGLVPNWDGYSWHRMDRASVDAVINTLAAEAPTAEPTPVQQVPASPVVSALALRGRLLRAELVAIDGKAHDAEGGQLASEARVFLGDLAAGLAFDLSSEDVRGLFGRFAEAGLIARDVAEILDAPVADGERA